MRSLTLYLFVYEMLAIMCPNETYQNANWLSIQSGQTQTGTCINNFSGSPTRQCTPSGSNGIWSPTVTNPCASSFPYILGLFVCRAYN